MNNRKKEVKIVLHTPHLQEDIVALQDIHNEMVVAVLRKRLSQSDMTTEFKEEYIDKLMGLI